MGWDAGLLHKTSSRGWVLMVREFLREHGLDALVKRIKCKTNRDEDYPNLVLLKYNQIESPMGDALAQQCRGIIVDEDNGWEIVSYPFEKFFNHGEQYAAEIDWDTAQVLEKLDGSILTLSYYNNEWLVSTSGNAGAKGEVPYAKEKNFEQLFWEVFNELEMSLPSQKDKSYIFELMTKENRVIIPHKENRLVLTGVRDLPSGKELMPEDFSEEFKCSHAQAYKINSLDGALEVASKLDGMKHEGFVIRDANFNRIKIKGRSYVGLHYLKSCIESSPRKLIEIVQANESEEFLTYLPEFKEQYDTIKSKYYKICDEITACYLQYKDIKDQRDFALTIKHLRYNSALFSVRSGKTKSIEQWMSELSSKKMEQLLGAFNG